MSEDSRPLAERISNPAPATDGTSDDAPIYDFWDSYQPAGPSTDNQEQPQKQDQSGSVATQTDGANEPLRGSALQDEVAYDVDVKLSDMQADPNNPLYSVKSFDELGL